MKILLFTLFLLLALVSAPGSHALSPDVTVCVRYIDDNGCVAERCDVCSSPGHCYSTFSVVHCPGDPPKK